MSSQTSNLLSTKQQLTAAKKAHEKRVKRLSILKDMLTYMRPDNSQHEQDFIDRFIMPLKVYVDDAGNLIKRIPNKDGSASKILWSCHVDTVHHYSGRQPVDTSDPGKWCLYTAPAGEEKLYNCLGADDTGGVFIMRQMICANVPGLYIFHRGEECGGNGSNHIARNTPEILDGIDFAIALDRKGTDSVITHQGGRCCSDAFGESLIAAIGNSTNNLEFNLDQTGTFTDTANYTDIVPECTNLSIGYNFGHSDCETLDANFVLKLLDSLINLDQSTLVVSRTPRETDFDGRSVRYRNLEKFYGVLSKCMADDDSQDFAYSRNPNVSISSLVRQHPDVAADLLEQFGIEVEDFYRALESMYRYGNQY